MKLAAGIYTNVCQTHSGTQFLGKLFQPSTNVYSSLQRKTHFTPSEVNDESFCLYIHIYAYRNDIVERSFFPFTAVW